MAALDWSETSRAVCPGSSWRSPCWPSTSEKQRSVIGPESTGTPPAVMELTSPVCASTESATCWYSTTRQPASCRSAGVSRGLPGTTSTVTHSPGGTEQEKTRRSSARGGVTGTRNSAFQ